MLPEDLCNRLSALAEHESRTVSNMAKVLIQEGVKQYEEVQLSSEETSLSVPTTEGFRSALESQPSRRLQGAPRRFKIKKT